MPLFHTCLREFNNIIGHAPPLLYLVSNRWRKKKNTVIKNHYRILFPLDEIFFPTITNVCFDLYAFLSVIYCFFEIRCTKSDFNGYQKNICCDVYEYFFFKFIAFLWYCVLQCFYVAVAREFQICLHICYLKKNCNK